MTSDRPVSVTTSSTSPTVLSGIGIGRGSALGSVLKLAPAPRPPANEPAARDPLAAESRVAACFSAVANGYRERAEVAQGATAAVLEATSLMAQDPGLLADVMRRINIGVGPATAVDQAIEGFCKILEASGPYLAERVTDLRDVRDRIVAKVLGVPEPGIPPLSKPTVIVATDLAPADTATLDLNHVVGIVTELGGPTSHTAIIAAALNLPCLVRVNGAMQLADDTPIAIDAAAGSVVLDPDDAMQEAIMVRGAKAAVRRADFDIVSVATRRHPNNNGAASAERPSIVQVDSSESAASAFAKRPSIVQVEAAKLRLVTDRRLGKKSPEWLQRVAKGLPPQSVKAAG